MQGIRLYLSQQPDLSLFTQFWLQSHEGQGGNGAVKSAVKENCWSQVVWSPLSTPKRTFLEPMEGKSELHWRFQDVGSSSVLGYLPRSESYRMMNLPDRVMYIIGSKAGRAETRSPWTCQTWNYMFEFSQLGFRLALVQYFLNISWFLIFGMVIHILCHCMFKVCNFFKVIFCAIVCFKYVIF